MKFPKVIQDRDLDTIKKEWELAGFTPKSYASGSIGFGGMDTDYCCRYRRGDGRWYLNCYRDDDSKCSRAENDFS
jgi:hypothetical protein